MTGPADLFPDVAKSGLPSNQAKLDWAGMADIEAMLRISREWAARRKFSPLKLTHWLV